MCQRQQKNRGRAKFFDNCMCYFSLFIFNFEQIQHIISSVSRQKANHLKSVFTRKHTKARQVFQKKSEHFLLPDTHTYTHKPLCLIIDVFILCGKVNNKATGTTLPYVFLVKFEYAHVKCHTSILFFEMIGLSCLQPFSLVFFQKN